MKIDATPRYSDLQQRRLKALDEALLALTPQQRQEAIKIAGKLLARKAKKRAQAKAELSARTEKYGDAIEPASVASISPNL